MKAILALSLIAALAACESVPLAADKECDRHRLDSAEHADCVAKLKSNEAALRKAD